MSAAEPCSAATAGDLRSFPPARPRESGRDEHVADDIGIWTGHGSGGRIVPGRTDAIRYYHRDRTHLGLKKDSPEPRPITPLPKGEADLVALPRVGGIHHRYEWRKRA